ncbi:DUF1801 domain-containing protein [Candidatus Falkowbacteria bacterium]|nr:DUF1801 domain-containing protein [Candidatus Falkowbacteria bacterium]
MKDLEQIFTALKSILERYNPPLIVKGANTAKPQYILWSVKDVVIAGRPRKEIAFAGLIIQKSYVGFYFMPTYANDELKKFFAPGLLKLLKGKSCFHIKELTPELQKEIEQALDLGWKRYEKNGWV